MLPRGWARNRTWAREWALWALPPAVLRYVFVVESLATLTVLGTLDHHPVTPRSVGYFALVAVGAVIHLEAARGMERAREIAAEGSPHVHLQSIWLFAGVLLLPPPLLAALVVLSYTHAWLRVYRRRTFLYRKVFSASTVILGCAAAKMILSASYGSDRDAFVRVLGGPTGLAALVAAAVAYWVINYALVVAAIMLSNPQRPRRAALGLPSDQLIIGAAIGLGTAVALLLAIQPWLAPMLMATVLALHLGLLLPQFRAASRTDSKTGLVDAAFWHEMAQKELERARRAGSGLGVLLVDLDHFKSVNDRHGHLAGDHVLRVVASEIKQATRGYGLVGRFGGEEFAVLLPDVESADALRAAEHIRQVVSQVQVHTAFTLNGPAAISGLTASVGVSVFPHAGAELTPMLLAADAALFTAKKSGRDRVCAAPPVAQARDQVELTD